MAHPGDDPASPTHKLGPDDAPADIAWSLVIVRDGEVSHHALPAQGGVGLGRGGDAAVQIPHRSVSRLHAMLHVLGDKLLLEDMGSANGTTLDGRRLAPGASTPLARGSVFELGSVIVLVAGAGAQLIAERRPDAGGAASGAATDRMVERVAQSAISVLLVGETGTGKEVLASRIHAASRRADRPMLRLNCAALTESLIESELFGHEKGAFTGADARKLGLLETAHGGTVFLDEVGELPAATQAKLLRVIEDRKVTRVGGLEARELDLRFISATHRDLEAEIASGRFRRDLYFRLAGVTIAIPPLRQRTAEIPALARGFILEACRRDGRDRVPVLAPAALAALERQPWPGNVRELRNAIDRAVALCEGDAITPADLPFAPAPATPARSALRQEVGSFELQRIVDAIEQCGGNQARAAKLLGISRRTLVDRLSRARLTRPRKR